MSSYINWLIYLVFEGDLIKIALQVDMNNLPGDCAEYPMEPENREYILSLLPDYYGERGIIVLVEEINDTIIKK